MVKPDRAVYTPTDFLSWRDTDTLSLTPKFQRRGVWKPAARSYFIDSILRGMPVPPIYMRVTQNTGATRIVREVIDGQQRIAAVLDFADGKYKLSKTLKEEWAGQSFDKLSPEQRGALRSYGFSVEVFHDVSDPEVLELFSRLNLYMVPLNSQELRNGQFFGRFKQTAYALALEYLEFWRRNRVFSEMNIARMLEVELTSELMIAQLDGMQDKKKSINDFYDRFDETFPAQAQVQKRFRVVVDEIAETVGAELEDTEFRRAPLFYTLWCVVYHRMFGLRHVSDATPKRTLNRSERQQLNTVVANLSEKIASARAGDAIGPRYATFVAACLRQTDNLKPREMRFRTVYRSAFD